LIGLIDGQKPCPLSNFVSLGLFEGFQIASNLVAQHMEFIDQKTSPTGKKSLNDGMAGCRDAWCRRMLVPPALRQARSMAQTNVGFLY
jgi:hypothetical protein